MLCDTTLFIYVLYVYIKAYCVLVNGNFVGEIGNNNHCPSCWIVDGIHKALQ